MERNILIIIFEDSSGAKFRLKINDVRADISSAEANALASKIIENDILDVKGKKLVEHISSELQKILVAIL